MAEEGGTKLVVPAESITSKAPPRRPVFFNPRGEDVRDISVLACRAYSSMHGSFLYGEPLAGAGARMLRILKEVKGIERGFANDINEEGMRIAALSARINDVADRLETSSRSAESFLSLHMAEMRFDVIDVDPFGSPTSYVELALKAMKDEGMLSITATDTAPLKGLYNRVAFRRYFGYSLRVDYSREIGMRLLCGMAVRRAMSLDVALKPIFVHSDQHYIRAYFAMQVGTAEADRNEDMLGFVHHCFRCGTRESTDIQDCAMQCKSCGNRMKRAGPLWIGSLKEKKFVERMIENCNEKWLIAHVKRLKKYIDDIDSPPYYFRLPDLADLLGARMCSPLYMVEKLRENGWKASLTGIDDQGVRTDAPFEALKEILLSLPP